MEETWEFAAVSDFDEYHREKRQRELDKPLVLEDFSPRVYSTQAKFFSVALVSIFIALFDLDPTSTLLGVRILDLNERLIEIGVFIISFSLFVLLFLRLAEERDVFLKVDRELKKITQAADSELKFLSFAHDNLVRRLNASPLLDGSIFKKIDLSIKNSDLLVEKLNADITKISAPEYVQKRYTETQMSLALIGSTLVNKVTESSEHLNSDTDKLRSQIDRFEKIILFFQDQQLAMLGRKRLNSKRKLRIIVFDYVLPIFTMLIASLTFIFPDKAGNIAQILKV